MLNIQNLSFSYGRKKIFHGLSFTVAQGDCIGIVGCNGCGKSTLLSVLAGCRPARSGSVFLEGCDIASDPSVPRTRIGYVPQEIPFIPELSVYDNLLFWYPGKKQDMDAALLSPICHALGIRELLYKRVSVLSGGQRKKAGIVSALLHHPALLLLDEPSSALDIGIRSEITDFLKSYLQNGGTVLLSTHEECELTLCNRLIAMRNGTIHEIPPSLRDIALLQQIQ